MDAIPNCWFKSYEEARACPQSEGGYLLPYKSHFFVTCPEGVRELGLDPKDSEWARIGWDGVRPEDANAWGRLKQKRELAA
jgi:hypothetical protein